MNTPEKYELFQKIQNYTKELEMLRKDPSASHEEISEIEAQISRHKLQYYGLGGINND